jgi:hypothetical protein
VRDLNSASSDQSAQKGSFLTMLIACMASLLPLLGNPDTEALDDDDERKNPHERAAVGRSGVSVYVVVVP